MNKKLLPESRNACRSAISSSKYGKPGLFLLIMMVMLISFQDTVLADLITIEAAGTIGEISAQDDDENDISADFQDILPFAVGSNFSATVIYDLSVADQYADPDRGTYDYSTPGGYFTWDIDGTVFSELDSLWVRTGDSEPAVYPYDYFNIATPSVQLPTGWSESDSFVDQMNMDFRDNDAIAFSSDALPISLSLGDFELKFVRLYTYTDYYGTLMTPIGSLSGEDFRITGEIESLSISRTITEPIPEPTTMLLLGTGLVGLAVPRIRKKVKK